MATARDVCRLFSRVAPRLGCTEHLGGIRPLVTQTPDVARGATHPVESRGERDLHDAAGGLRNPRESSKACQDPASKTTSITSPLCQDCHGQDRVQGADPPLQSYSSCVVLESKSRKTVATKVILLKSEYFPIF